MEFEIYHLELQDSNPLESTDVADTLQDCSPNPLESTDVVDTLHNLLGLIQYFWSQH